MVALARDAIRAGVPFDTWWREAVRPGAPPILVTSEQPWPSGCVIWPSDSADRNNWRLATDRAIDGWRRAYEGVPATQQEKALRILEPLLGSAALSAPLPSVALAA